MENCDTTSSEDRERMVMAALPMAQLVFGLSYGILPPVLCQAAGVSPLQLTDRSRFVPHAWYFALWDALRAHCPGVPVGIEFGKFMTPDHFGFAGQAFRNARDGLDALHKLVRFGCLLDSRASEFPSQIAIDDQTISVDGSPLIAEGMLECVEANMFGFVTQLNALTEVPVRVLEVRCHLDDQRHRHIYEEFFCCPIRFGCETSGFTMARDTLRAPLRGANVAAGAHIDAYIAESYATSRAESFGAKLQRIVESQVRDGSVSQPEAARSLGLSVRALQRRLSKDGKSFAEIVEEVRRSAALRMLRETDAAVYEVAFCLGYQDVSSFNRVFKRWLGTSPSAYRERKRGVPTAAEPSHESESMG
jgi:AraC-like DNA-binding protein